MIYLRRDVTGPSDRWYDPPDPVICCPLAEDEPGHDVQECLAGQADADAERRWEQQRDRQLEDRWEP